MSGGIYLVQDGGGLVELSESPYAAEEILQRLLADYPNLLAGNQVDPGNPRRWLLVSRETAVPGEEGGAGRWSLDHLFLDQDAVPTLVEVKRGTDTRVRREVVGQMLDYAANAVVYWPVEAIRAQFEATRIERGENPNEALVVFLGDENIDEFWLTAKRNLQAGRIRMVFVADKIPPELQRIVEFLDGQMDPAQVLAVEVRQFTGEGITALVPTVVGQTAAAQQAKSSVRSDGKRQWDEPSFFKDLATRRGQKEAAAARAVLDWARGEGLRIWWGKGEKDGSFYPMLNHHLGEDWTVSVRTSGRLTFEFGNLARKRDGGIERRFENREMRMELLRRVNEIPGVSLPDTVIDRYPSIPIALLTEQTALDVFMSTLQWLVTELRTAGPA